MNDTLRVIPRICHDNIGPAGAMYSSVSDMALWMRFLLDSARLGGKRVLSARGYADLFAPHILVDDKEFYPTAKLTHPRFQAYGQGWFLEDYRGEFIAFHTGSIDGTLGNRRPDPREARLDVSSSRIAITPRCARRSCTPSSIAFLAARTTTGARKCCPCTRRSATSGRRRSARSMRNTSRERSLRSRSLATPVCTATACTARAGAYRETIEESDEEPVDVVATLRDAAVDVLICYLPVGSEHAAKFYAQCAIDAGVAFVNALPVFIASTPEWAAKFEEAGVPIVGDDIKSQVGATITHRVLAKLFEDRGVELQRTMQLNVGGNMDFLNMLERDRLESKKISKTQAVTSQIPDRDLGKRNVHIGPSDYVAWLDDRKWAYVRLEGKAFGTSH